MSFRNCPVVAIISARGGSKGIPRKNITPCAGKPLMQYSIEAALGSSVVDSVVVSSDDAEILDLAGSLGAVPLMRPAEMATDQASSHPLIGHAIEALQLQDSYIVLLQPTSPLRTARHIDDAFLQLDRSRAENLVSVHLMEKSPYKAYRVNADGYLESLFGNEQPYQRRQDLPDVYYPNGAIYIFTARNFLVDKKIPLSQAIPFEMTLQDSIDIDNKDDLLKAELILKACENG